MADGLPPVAHEVVRWIERRKPLLTVLLHILLHRYVSVQLESRVARALTT